MSRLPGNDSRQAEFDGEELLGLLAEVDAELPAEAQVEIAAIGGGVLALRWADRATADLDVVSESMPLALRSAAARVAGRHNLRPDWINDAAKIKTPDLDPQLELLFAGDRLTVYGAGPRYLLATKLFAARAHDFDDALRLAAETGITDADDMLDLLADAYPHRLLTPRIEYHARQVAEAAQAGTQPGQGE
ncbi:MAG: hypothetical protein OXG55_17185 [bacterium]|nr:hypothetical protein [bacterium]